MQNYRFQVKYANSGHSYCLHHRGCLKSLLFTNQHGVYTQVSVSSKCAIGQQERKHKATTHELTSKLKVNIYQSQFLTTKELKFVRMSGYE